MSLVIFAKATIVGDILNESLSKVAWISKSGPAGLFANVSLPQTTDPAKLGLGLANVFLDVAIAAISSIPIVGQIIGAVVQVARFLFRIFTAPTEAEPELLLPWTAYSDKLDEDFGFFCGGAGPETVMEVEALEGIKYSADAITIKGILKLNDKDINRLMYKLVNVKLVKS